MRLKFPVFLLAAMLCAAACEDTATTTPTSTAPPITDPPYTGTIGKNNGTTFQFTSTARGSVQATVTTLDPDSAVIGVAIGVWNGTSCQLVQVKDDAIQGSTVATTASGVGNLCLRVYDSGKVTDPVTYSVTLVHP